MAKQSIGLGSVADDGTGDTLRIAGDKVNDNFDELYTTFGDGSTLTSVAVTAINNATANELVTIGATTTELDAEANLTFDGSTLAVTGILTVDDINLNGKVITMTGSPDDTFSITAGTNGATTLATTDAAGTAGNLTLDADGSILLNTTNSGLLYLQDSGSNYGALYEYADHLYLKSTRSNADMIFQGNDGGSTITALTLDMSAAGAATFNGALTVPGHAIMASITGSGVIKTNSTTEATTTTDGSLQTDGGLSVVKNIVAGDQVTLLGASGKVKRDGTAAFIVMEAGGTDGAGTHAGDNIIDETDSDDIILEDQIFHHTGHASVSLTIFDSGGAVVKSLIGVHQDTSELN